MKKVIKYVHDVFLTVPVEVSGAISSLHSCLCTLKTLCVMFLSNATSSINANEFQFLKSGFVR